MPGPPPPPPPGCPPPPMPASPFVPAKGGKGGADDRSALLNAIRKAPKLQKVDRTLINDRSGPLVASQGKSDHSASAASSAGHSGPPNGLGGMFQGGMPKLKAVNKNTSDAPSVNINAGGGNFMDIQDELRKRLNNDNKNSNRGPAPPAPARNLPNEFSSLQSKNGYQFNHNKINNQMNSHSHRKTQSNGNFSPLEGSPATAATTTTTTATGISKSNTMHAEKLGHRKPNVAPKPPVLEKPSPSLNNKLRKSHSVRLPSPPISPVVYLDHNHSLTLNQNDMEKSRTLGGSTGQLSPFKFKHANGRPTVPPPSIPLAKVKPPNHAPPPPPATTAPQIPLVPNHAPPPPPHRTVPPVPTRAPPAVPNSNAPAPPPRNSSMTTRPLNGGGGGVSFENRFHFHPVSDFPPPMPFRNVEKVYTSRQAGKQQAPQPPSNQIQQQIQLAGSNRLWESSTC